MYLFKHIGRNQDAAGLRNPLQPGRDIDAIAVDIFGIGGNFAKINADTELHPPGFGRAPIAPGEVILHTDGAFDCLCRGAKFSEEPVAGMFDNAAAKFSDGKID